MSAPSPAQVSLGRAVPQATHAWLEFNIHDGCAIRVDRSAPTASLLSDMFAPFLTSGIGRPDLTISGRIEPVSGASHAETDYTYTESSLYLNDIDVQVLLKDDGFHLNGTRELLVTALPLIDRILVTNGVAMIHAATVNYRGHGVCMPAWGGTGKTSTIAKLLRLEGVAFMGDDWAFLAKDGRLLGYAKPMFIKPHHRPLYPHLFASKPKPLVPTRLSRPVGKLTTLVHPLITRYPQLARITRRWSPEHMMVAPQQAFPRATFSSEAPLALTVFVERFDGDRAVLEEKSQEWMVSRLVGNFHAEIKHHSHELITALGATGLVPLDRAFGEKAAVIDEAIAGKPAFLLRVPLAMQPDRASDVIVEYLHKAFAVAGIA